jgi:MFS family permease
MITLPVARTEPRTRSMASLFSGVALMNAAMAAASAVSTIVAADRLGTAWGAVPNTAGILGTGIGALTMTRVMNRHGRRTGLVLGYLAAALGGVLAVVSVATGEVIGLTAGMLLLGLGNAGAQLSRYAAAELYPAARRGFAIGIVIWAGTLGAVGGPLLLMPSGDMASGLGAATLTGPFLLAAVAAGAAMFAALSAPARTVREAPPRVPLRQMARTHTARSALAVMATAQVIMVAVMTAAPLDMHMHGQGLGSVGEVLSAHTFGMFALSPLTGWLLDRIGSRPVMLAGLLTLMMATGLAALAPYDQTFLRTAALFLLGYGWNLCFVGGSGRLAADLATAERASIEGAVDAAVWSIAAVAGLASTVILSTGGYALLAACAGLLALLPAIMLLKKEGLPAGSSSGRRGRGRSSPWSRSGSLRKG